MKIFTKTKKQSIENRLCNTITDYAVEDREIMTITLDYDEYKEFRAFMRRSLLHSSYQGKYTYLFMAVSVRPNRAAVERLDREWGGFDTVDKNRARVDLTGQYIGERRVAVDISREHVGSLPPGIYSGKFSDGFRYRFQKTRDGKYIFKSGTKHCGDVPHGEAIDDIIFFPDAERRIKF